MHGPDAATVMRKEFKFRGPIIGKRVRGVVLRIRVTIMTLSIIVYMNTIAILRGYRQCSGGRHCHISFERGQRSAHEATHESQAHEHTLSVLCIVVFTENSTNDNHQYLISQHQQSLCSRFIRSIGVYSSGWNKQVTCNIIHC